MTRASGAFVGRAAELALLERELDAVRETGRGRLLIMRGRRRVGKSRLVEEFLGSVRAASCFFTASRQPPDRELALFQDEVWRSNLPVRDQLDRDGVTFGSWDAALNLATTGLERTTPAVVVIDEFPYLRDDGGAIEGAFQKVWDRVLSGRPVLLVLVGSDLSVMEALTEYGRPLYGRYDRAITVEPLTPADLATMLDLDASTAIDAYLVLGGFPQLAERWRRGGELRAFLDAELAEPTSPLIVNAERALTAEFPAEVQARAVCEAIGAGQRTFKDIARTAGVGETTLQRALEVLVREKRLVRQLRPLSSRASRESHYEIADPYLRFWLRFVRPSMDLVERGRGRDVAGDILSRWTDYRGIAVEPLVRAALDRLAARGDLGAAREIGSYWTRSHDVEVDLVGAHGTRSTTVAFVGSIKWRDRKRFDASDAAALAAARSQVPGADDAQLVGVSRTGFDDGVTLDHRFEPDDLLGAWEEEA